MIPAILDKTITDSRKRRDASLFRVIPQKRSVEGIDLSTNSYLALHNDKRLQREAHNLTKGIYSGNLSSRLLSQSSPLYDTVENEIAEWKGCESALLFNSGYAANTGLIAALCSRNSAIFCDRLNHASILDGCILSGARMQRYKHNDMNDLKERLKASTGAEKLIVTDTVFSMDGDTAPLADICQLAKEYGAAVMVDEAHATGIFGKTASGLVEESGTEDGVHIRMGTLSKAVGGLGGFFAGPAQLRDFFVNNARSLIYSTGLPQSVLAYDLCAIRFIRKNPALGKELRSEAKKFRSMLKSNGFDTMNSSTQIIPLVTNSSEKALSLSAYLRDNGVFAPAIRTPTVPVGTERIRMSLHCGITSDEIGKVLHLITEWKKHNE
ncbi:8-amino-7-oxononanoate synthase [Chitinispirillales bacterium ANBcel5]|uniref:aminotransferase class I/II-fold pyridoxal phosphate-dependent enzyme n=1 Tax=Cellulosispirillum alkaliphilum TaxID=3039283 RepID=UPI002A524B62|nr:8-amino-7-oxononanoate synthase [Chitinispirillales bacterium ANBcel5]